MKNQNPTNSPAWFILKEHYREIHNKSILSFFEDDSNRFKDFSLKESNLFLDFSKNIMNRKTFSLLLDLATESNLKQAIDEMFVGNKINKTENRAVLHTALRSFSKEPIFVDNNNILPLITNAREKMKSFSTSIRNGEWTGCTNKKITDIVNIGIGGSDLGPKMVCSALKAYSSKNLNVHFVSNVDPTHLHITLEKLNPETTLFMIASKTFTTQETMANAENAKKWFLDNNNKYEDIKKHFIALSTNIEKVTEFGIDKNNMFEFWDFVGGRYSVWSSIGLSIACYIGYDNFEKFLKGANSIDIHFKNAPFAKNMPVILALVGIWYNNFFNSETEAILPYDQYLDLFPDYFQQGNMESNGKSIDRNGNLVNYQTGPIIWGKPGTNGQHAFYQLIHQGTKFIPADFLAPINSLSNNTKQHEILIANFLAQTESLMIGRKSETVKKEMEDLSYSKTEIEQLLPFRIFKGNKPTNTILYDSLTPESLGSLIALYEHKIFTQGVIWNVFSFDQWGVELGKKMASRILKEIQEEKINKDHDDSTFGLLSYYLNNRK